ncbi:MAG: pyrroloquinoline quinone biosynthesis protein PqqE [Pseudomonadota bacterium]
MAEPAPPPAPPLAMLAELTHRCPLMCPYCSNPLDLARKEVELETEEWARVLAEAAEIGVLQLHLSGGEPASRRDLEAITEAAVKAGLYTNLITSGVGLTARRLEALADLGLDHVQLSLQGVNPQTADLIGGYDGGFKRKMAVAEEVAKIGLPLTLNAVMHRRNLDDLPETIQMAIDLGARRIEVACVQFHGWAARNRAALQPTREQVDAAKRLVDAARVERRGRLVIDFVPPDYYSDYPKACMGGWGSTGLVVAPSGRVMPCHAADSIPHLEFQNVRDAHLGEIWREGPAFTAYRGVEWMAEPCRSCERRDVDFGGCRCQAMALAGDAAATDPVCRKSPKRHVVDALLAEEVGTEEAFVYRR